MTHRNEKRHFPTTRRLTTILILIFIILSFLIPGSNSNISKVEAADLELPTETQYEGLDTGLRGDDRYSSDFEIGFNFTYFGNTYSTFRATTNGIIYFDGGNYNHYSNSTIPSTGIPNDAIYVFWDDLYSYDDTQLVLYRTIGEIGSRELIVQWTNYGYFSSDLPMGTFQVILYEGTNNIRFQYRQLLTASRSYGQSATIGLENLNGTAGVQYSSNTESLDPEQSILWTPSGGSYTYNSGAAYEGVFLYDDNPPPNVPELASPTNGSAGVSTTPTFTWNSTVGADTYNLVVSTYSNLSSPFINLTDLSTTSYTSTGLLGSPPYYWAVEAVNASGSSWSSVWIFTTSAGNSAPDDLVLSNDSISQDLPSGTTVGSFTTSDPDAGDTHTYALVDGGGSSDNSSFSISGNTLLTAASLSAGDYTIRVRSTDNGGLSIDKVFLIHVTEPNVAPTDISLSHISIAENEPANSTLGTFSTTDANTSDSFVYSFVSGTGDTDNSAFSISGSSLTINNSPDYETKTSYSILVRSTDLGGLYTEKHFTISVLDMVDPTTTTITSDSPDPSVVGQPYTVTVTVAPASGGGTPTGTVYIGDGIEDCSAFLSSGTGSCSLTSTSAGTKALTASYFETDGWGSSSDTETHTVNKAATTTSITSINPEPSEMGSDYTIFFSVTADAPSTSTIASGIVEVTVDGSTTNVPFTNGTGSLSVNGDSVGSFAILATYLGDASHFNDSSDSTNHEVVDTTSPDVQINQDSGQNDPTNSSPILFYVYFDESVTGFTSDDISFAGSTAPGTLAAAVTGSGDSYTVSVSGMTGSGTVIPSIPANSAVDPSYNGNTASYSFDNSVTYDITDPTVTINQASGQADPTAQSPILFDVEFSEAVTGFSASDVSFTGSTAPGTLLAAVTGSGTTYQVSISGMTGSGNVVVSIPADSANDQVGNGNETSTSTDNSVEYDVTPSTVTINQASTQSDPTRSAPILFDVVFSEPVTDFTGSDVDLTSSTTPGTLSAAVSGSGATYQVSISGMTGSGLVIASIPSDSAVDAADNGNGASTSTDNSVTYDVTAPTVTIEQAATQMDPTRLSPINFEVTFDEPVTGFEPSDINFTGSTAPGNLSAAIGGTGPTYNILVSGMTDSGLVIVSIPANAAVDASGNTSEASTSTDNSVTYDVTPPTVTINQGDSQADPANTEPIVFDVVFSETVIGFDETDLVITGMVNLPSIVINGSGDTYTVEISGLINGETITADVKDNAVVDTSGNENTASTSTDNSVLFDITPIYVMESGVVGFPGSMSITPDGKYFDRFSQIKIEFDSDAYNPPGDTEEDDVTNPSNYYLIDPGENDEFEITECPGDQSINATLMDDVLIPVGPVTYDNNGGVGPFISTLTVNNGEKLPLGTYRLLICGSTTIMDLAGNPLNGGEDISIDFSIIPKPSGLPLTGFSQGQVTVLPEQEKAAAYNNAGMVLALPKLGVSAQIVGVPLDNDGWNTTWLGNNAGYLEGSAFPTWEGNTVITGHIWTSTNKPGIFLNLSTLQYGDEVQIYAWGQVYTYQVRSNYLVSETNVNSVMQSRSADWLTLLTCDGYDPETGTYAYRRVVNAVLISVD